jgi:hypothetical protein
MKLLRLCSIIEYMAPGTVQGTRNSTGHQELLDVGLQLGGLADVHGLQRLLHDVPEVLNMVYYLFFLAKASRFYYMAAVNTGFWTVRPQEGKNSPSVSAL